MYFSFLITLIANTCNVIYLRRCYYLDINESYFCNAGINTLQEYENYFNAFFAEVKNIELPIHELDNNSLVISLSTLLKKFNNSDAALDLYQRIMNRYMKCVNTLPGVKLLEFLDLN